MNEYPQGAPCWFELATSDQQAAKQFYTQLFGWSIVDSPMGPDSFYTMFKLDGRDVGAAYTLTPDMVQRDIPPHWGVYFATADAGATAAKITERGGAIIHPPFDVMEHGRMAVCKDPGNAVFSIWQPNAHRGAGVFGDNNTVCWAELATWDLGKARDFYSGVFGWETKGSQNMPTYLEYYVGGRPWGGLMAMDDDWKGIPSHWGIYFMVADCDATTDMAKRLGATVRHGPFSAPGVGRIVILADPQGAGFSLITLERPM